MRNFVVFLMLFLSTHFVLGQNWGIQTSMLVQPIKKSFDNRFDGASFQMYYKKTFYEKLHFIAGIEGQINSWGNHVLLIVGGEYIYFKNERWSSNVRLNIGNGIALFQPNLLYSFNSKGQIFWNYRTKKQNIWGIGVGLQLMITPEYKSYSSIYSTVNVPVTLQYNF